MKIIKTSGYKESQGNPSLFDPFECAACGEQKEYEEDYAGLAKFTDGVEKLSDTFGISKDSFVNAETIGVGNYSISIGKFKDNWYACEDDGTNPQIWKFKTKKELARAIKSDTGLEI
jgi:hypothetical protein